MVSNDWDDVTGGGDAGVLVVLAINGSVWMSIECWRLMGGEELIDDGPWETGELARGWRSPSDWAPVTVALWVKSIFWTACLKNSW